MATSNGTGASARPNPSEKRPREGASLAAGREPVIVSPERHKLALQAAWEIEALMDASLMLTADGAGENDLAVHGISIRTRDLAGAVMHALGDEVTLDDVHRTVYGTHRATEGAAS